MLQCNGVVQLFHSDGSDHRSTRAKIVIVVVAVYVRMYRGFHFFYSYRDNNEHKGEECQWTHHYSLYQ